MIELDRQAFLEAIDRIASTADGAILYRYLQKTLMGVCTETSALNAHEGKRLFASELMGLMSQGIETHDRTDAVVVFSLAGPKRRDADRIAGAGRRITRDTYIAGFDDPDSLAVSEPAGPA